IAQEFFAAFNEKVGARHASGEPAAHAQEEHHAGPVARDPDLPVVSDASLVFLAAGALVVFVVALFALLG
ncbi:MAG TPA: hypothetical protein VFX50_18365, partial [Gemmatimonadales bacterium]|nr:hypothetical protein [Gemmatimonadales bacterium]